MFNGYIWLCDITRLGLCHEFTGVHLFSVDWSPCIATGISEPPTNKDSSVFIRILKLITDEKLKNTDD